MELVQFVDKVVAYTVTLETGDKIVIAASGKVNNSGWTRPRLSQRFYIEAPKDGIQEFDFIVDQPADFVVDVELPVAAELIYTVPEWDGGVKGIRVYGEGSSNYKDAIPEIGHAKRRWKTPSSGKIFIGSSFRQIAFTAKSTNIVSYTFPEYDDSWQPTGTVHWKGVVPHPEMKKLHHTVTLLIAGPSEDEIRSAIQKALAIGVIAAAVAAIAGGGPAVPAGISAFMASLKGFLGDTFQMDTKDDSHWIYWDV